MIVSKVKIVFVAVFCLLTIYSFGQTTSFSPSESEIRNGTIFTDTQGNIVHAHGGGFIKVGVYYYWIGENRQDNNLVSCYRSTDLVHWEFRGILLSRNSDPELEKANVERPKVIYNEQTKTFVMWMHYELRRDYSVARCAVASSKNVEGPYTYHGSFRPDDNMSRDCNLFKDSDGKAYFISSTRNNLDMNVYELTPDYLHVKSKIATLWPGAMREAPAVVKKGDYYLMLSSYCTGWKPNQGKYAYSLSMAGPWSSLRNFGSPTTFDTQPTYILPVEGSHTTSYIYVGDRWDPASYSNSSYVFLPLSFKNDTTMELNWANTLKIDIEKGTTETTVNKPMQFRFKYRANDNYLSPRPDGCIGIAGLNYKSAGLLWELVDAGNGCVRIKNKETGKYLEPLNGDPNSGAKIVLADFADHQRQLWKVETSLEGWSKIINQFTGKILQMERSQQQVEYLVQSELNTDLKSSARQQFLFAWEYL